MDPDGPFKVIEKPYSMNPLENLQVQTPALLFMPGKDTAGETTAQNPVKQMVTRRVHVFILGPVDQIQTLSNLVRPLLIQYRPFGNKSYTLLELEEGAPTDIKGVMWYVETYRTKYQLSTLGA